MTSSGHFLFRLTPTPPNETTGFQPGQARLSLHVKADTEDVDPYLDLCSKVTSYFDSQLGIFRVNHSHYENINDAGRKPGLNDVAKPGTDPSAKGDFPAFSVIVFLKSWDPSAHKSSPSPNPREAHSSAFHDVLGSWPWKLHHKERRKSGHGKVTPANANAGHHDLYYTSSHLPLWGLRHVHYGPEHVRFVLYTSHNLWDDQVQFYTLLLGLDPELLRDDFCLFTVQSEPDNGFDVQFSLKRLPESKTVSVLDRFHLQVKVRDIGQLVPLFPNICRPLSDVIWQTTDHDGNSVFLDVVRTRQSAHSSANASYRLLEEEEEEVTPVSAISVPQQQHPADVEAWSRPTGSQNITASEMCEEPRLYQKAYENVGKMSPLSPERDPFIECPTADVAMATEFEDNDKRKGIDLCSSQHHSFIFPSRSQPRGGAVPDEDEESLTLTNTSEESGIQVFPDEGTSCENETHFEIRPCLSKAGSKGRSGNRRVHFSDEIEAFEDDSVSCLSSGFESDDQSDVEIMETRFPATMQGMNNCSGFESGHQSAHSFVSSHEQIGSKRMFDEKTSFRRNMCDIDYPENGFHNLKRNMPDTIPTSHEHIPTDRGKENSSFPPNTSFHNSMFSSPERTQPILQGEVTFKRKPPSYEVATKRLAELANRAKSPICPSPTAFSSFETPVAAVTHDHITSSHSHRLHQDQNQNQLIDSQSLSTSFPFNEATNQNSSNKSSNCRKRDHGKNRQHPLPNKQINRTFSPHPSMTHTTTPDLQEEDQDVNFNLKFDTCPTASGEPRKEQIGFFV